MNDFILIAKAEAWLRANGNPGQVARWKVADWEGGNLADIGRKNE